VTDLVIPEIVQSAELQLPPGAVPGVVDHWLRTYIPSTQTTYKSTVAKYERLIGEPFEYLLASRGRCFATASAFKTKLMESGAANATVNRHLAALRAFVEHCGPSGLAVVEWALKIGDLPSKPYRTAHRGRRRQRGCCGRTRAAAPRAGQAPGGRLDGSGHSGPARPRTRSSPP